MRKSYRLNVSTFLCFLDGQRKMMYACPTFGLSQTCILPGSNFHTDRLCRAPLARNPLSARQRTVYLHGGWATAYCGDSGGRQRQKRTKQNAQPTKCEKQKGAPNQQLSLLK